MSMGKICVWDGTAINIGTSIYLAKLVIKIDLWQLWVMYNIAYHRQWKGESQAT